MAGRAAAESRQQIGSDIIGCLLLGTFFMLLVVPTVCPLLARRKPGQVAERRGASEAC